MTLRLVTVVGARPEFVQVGTIARAIEAKYAPTGLIEHLLVHTGQHYDTEMSDAFFEQLGLPEPAHWLGVGSGSHGGQTGAMLNRLDPLIRELAPDVVAVFGDTNSTLAGALAAAKLNVTLAHIESGLRSFNLAMPEEINRRVSDHVASVLFCPSQTAVDNLAAEGITRGVHLTGDVMHEAMLHALSLGSGVSSILSDLSLNPTEYVFATAHRSENTDDPERLNQILLGISDVAQQGIEVIFPVHPRTRSRTGTSPARRRCPAHRTSGPRRDIDLGERCFPGHDRLGWAAERGLLARHTLSDHARRDRVGRDRG